MSDQNMQSLHHQQRLEAYQSWIGNTKFMSLESFNRLINTDHSVIIPSKHGASIVCVVRSAQDLLEIATRLDRPQVLVSAGLLKSVYIEDNPDQDEIEMSAEAGELLIQSTEHNIVKRSMQVVVDINQFYSVDERVHVQEKEVEQVNYKVIPEALTEYALTAQYPAMLLISDHSESDRMGGFEIRHTMLLDLPPGVEVSFEGNVAYRVQ